jgi:hypothetical protein
MCSNSLYYITLLYVFICLYFRIITILTLYSVLLILYFVLTFPHPGLSWIYGNKDDDDDDETIASVTHNKKNDYNGLAM